MATVSNTHIKTGKINFTGILTIGIANGSQSANQDNCVNNNDAKTQDVNRNEFRKRKSNRSQDVMFNNSSANRRRSASRFTYDYHQPTGPMSNHSEDVPESTRFRCSYNNSVPGTEEEYTNRNRPASRFTNDYYQPARHMSNHSEDVLENSTRFRRSSNNSIHGTCQLTKMNV